MKNLASYDTDKIDLLHNGKSHNHRCRYGGNDYPYKIVKNFLMSRIGYPWNNVISEFVRKQWIPIRFRLPSKLAEHVEVNTFLKNDKVYFYHNYTPSPNFENNCVETQRRRTFYVHPQTRLLSVFHPQKLRNQTTLRKQKQCALCRVLGDYHQLLKIKGTWFEIKGYPSNPVIVVIDDLHYQKIKPSPEYHNDKYYKIIDGCLLVPIVTKNTRSIKPIGPKDPMLKIDNQARTSTQLDYDSVEIFYRKQLSHKELIKYNLHNDPIVVAADQKT